MSQISPPKIIVQAAQLVTETLQFTGRTLFTRQPPTRDSLWRKGQEQARSLPSGDLTDLRKQERTPEPISHSAGRFHGDHVIGFLHRKSEPESVACWCADPNHSSGYSREDDTSRRFPKKF